MAIATIALNLILENLIRFGFGNDLRGYDLPLKPDLRFLDLRIGPQQIENVILAAAIVMAAVFVFLRHTRFGKAMRAVADNVDLARLKGIDPQLVAVVTCSSGRALGGRRRAARRRHLHRPARGHAHPADRLRRGVARRPRLHSRRGGRRFLRRHCRGTRRSRRAGDLSLGHRLCRHPAHADLPPRGLLGERAV